MRLFLIVREINENFKVKNGKVVYEVEGESLFKIKAPEGTEIEIRDTDIK